MTAWRCVRCKRAVRLQAEWNPFREWAATCQGCGWYGRGERTRGRALLSAEQRHLIEPTPGEGE